MYTIGCDHILGHGTHWSGPIDFVLREEGRSQQTQEGVIVELAFRGTTLAQARLHPYVMIDQAQVNLTDPPTDGAYVLQRIFENSDTSY